MKDWEAKVVEKDLPVAFLPNRDYFLIERDEVKKETPGGIVLPSTSDDENIFHIGTIVAENGISDDKAFHKFNLGDKVAYRHEEWGVKINVGGVNYDLVGGREIYGTYGRLS